MNQKTRVNLILDEEERTAVQELRAQALKSSGFEIGLAAALHKLLKIGIATHNTRHKRKR